MYILAYRLSVPNNRVPSLCKQCLVYYMGHGPQYTISDISKKYAHEFAVRCFIVVLCSVPSDLRDLVMHSHRNCSVDLWGNHKIVLLPQWISIRRLRLPRGTPEVDTHTDKMTWRVHELNIFCGLGKNLHQIVAQTMNAYSCVTALYSDYVEYPIMPAGQGCSVSCTSPSLLPNNSNIYQACI